MGQSVDSGVVQSSTGRPHTSLIIDLTVKSVGVWRAGYTHSYLKTSSLSFIKLILTAASVHLQHHWYMVCCHTNDSLCPRFIMSLLAIMSFFPPPPFGPLILAKISDSIKWVTCLQWRLLQAHGNVVNLPQCTFSFYQKPPPRTLYSYPKLDWISYVVAKMHHSITPFVFVAVENPHINILL